MFSFLKLAPSIAYLKSWEQKCEKNSECCDDPDDQDPLVADVEDGEAHVGRQLLHRLDIVLNG